MVGVGIDGLFADDELRGDFSTGQSARDQFRYFLLARAELLEALWAALAGRRPAAAR